MPGQRMLRSPAQATGYGADFLPPNLTTCDVHDPRDPVACAGDLSMRWPGIRDEVVDNGDEAHSVERYLGKRATGDAIWRTLIKKNA